MPAAMLQDLFRPRGLDDFPGPFARQARTVAEELRERWERTCRDAAEHRKLGELHAARDEYHALLNGHIRLLEEYRTLTDLHGRAFGPSLEGSDELDRALGEMRSLRDGLFPRWQSLDDLYQIVFELLTPSAERQKELAAKYPPPQSWYEETDDPFSAD